MQIYDLTNPQNSIWVTEEFFKGSAINNICGTAFIKQKVNFDLLKKAIILTMENNDIFKIKFYLEQDTIMQYVSDNFNSDIIHLHAKNASDLEQMQKEIVSKSFNLFESNPYNFYVFEFPNKHGAFMLNIHHILADSWTLGFISKQIIRTYSALVQNDKNYQIPTSSYIDYILSERDYKNSERFKKDKQYWNDQFSTIPELPFLSGSKKASIDLDNISAERNQYTLNGTLLSGIKNYCKENNISLYNFFMAIYAIYINYISGLSDFVIGTPILNRTNYKEKHTAGMFINVAPFRIDFSNVVNFKDLIKKISIRSLNMLKHQKYSYQSLLEDLRKEHKNIPNLYNILFSYQITSAQEKESGINHQTSWTFNGNCAENMDIQILDINDTGKLHICYDYRTSIYSKKDINDLHVRILYIIKQVISHQDVAISNIEVITPKEKNLLLNKFNNTKIHFRENNVLNLFKHQVIKQPSKIAVIANSESLTYKELDEKSDKLASYLYYHGVNKYDIVGLMLHRSLETAVGLIAILKCGATYLPIDPEYPIDRINYMMENSSSSYVLVNSKTYNMVSNKFNKINIELSNTEIYNSTFKNVNISIAPTNLAYLIYTSGSTGKPKGVKINHKNLGNFVNGMKRLINFNKNRTMVSVTTICFDIFGLEFWCSLCFGLKLVIANEEEQNSPELLNKLCLENSVNIIQTTPSRFSTIFEEEKNLEFLKNISDILIGGEALNPKILTTIKSKSKANIFNVYGPTETTIWSTVKDLTHEDTISIGHPIANTQIYILNSAKKILPINTPGELYIGGDGLSEGYMNRPDLTNKQFINSPFEANKKIYNTNDLAYFTETGDIVHLGRTDFQVKVRGYRVELEEIETIIQQHPNIISAVVTLKNLEEGHSVLVAYYTTNYSHDLEDELKHEISKKLPNYMMPTFFVKLAKMPYTQNGKIDRKALPLPQVTYTKKEIIKPRNEIDKKLIEIMENLLHIHNINISDTLIELGGDSLSAISLSTKISTTFDTYINIKNIIEFTIKDLSDYIKENASTSKRIKIEPTPKQDFYPLSSAQRRIYYNTKMINEKNIVYNLPGGILADTILDIDKIKSILQIIISRHSTLRTSFVIHENQIMQQITDTVDFNIPVFYNKHLELQDIIDNFSKPFKLEKEPLFRVEIHYLDNKKTLLLFEAHHIIMDGTGLNNIIIEFNRLYNDENLKTIPIEYKDYAIWENTYTTSDAILPLENYWVEKFKGSDFSELNLPYDFKTSVNRTYKGKKIAKTLNEKHFKKISQLATANGVSPYMVFLSAFFILLYKYTGQNDINIGIPFANREFNETKRMIGMFVNNIVARGKINPEITFKDFLTEIKNQELNDLSNGSYPFDMLVKKLNIPRDTSRNPIFDVMFIYQNNEETFAGNKNWKIQEIYNNNSKFNLSLEIKPTTNKINIEYRTDLFKQETVERLFDHYINVIDTILENIDIKISDISVLSKSEKNQILYKFNHTSTNYPKHNTVIELFEEQVRKTPNNIAVVFYNISLTYKELNEKADQLANYLKAQNIHRGDVIGILLDKSIEMIVAILAILKSGCTYLPIDIGYPKDRIDYILKDSQSSLLLTSNKLNLDADLLIKSLYIDIDNTNIYNSDNKCSINYKGKNTDLAYIMYTSGSTGKPKGVMIENRSIVRLVKNTNYIKFNKHDKILQTGSIVFDACTFEIWGALLNGLELYIIKKEELLDASSLHTFILKNGITILWLTSPLFNQLSEENPHMFRTVRCLLTGGDVLSTRHINIVRNANPNLTIINGYGPTENTTFSCCHIINKNYQKSIPIGHPISNSTCYIMSSDGNLQPIGVPGELWVGGAGVARGYLNKPELTNDKFIKNPFGDERVYKTGDLAKWNSDGTIEFLGRIDSQIKIRGFRVELSEITSVISQYPNIKEAYTTFKEVNNEKSICTYLVSKKNIDIAELKTYLTGILPQYMIPKYIMQLPKLPKNQNGKIDKNSLPLFTIIKRGDSQITLPSSKTEKQLYDIFKLILNIQELSIEDNFFDYGGDSISAMKLQIECLKKGLSITYGDIFKYQTIKSLANFLDCSTQNIEYNAENDFHKYDNLIMTNSVSNLAKSDINNTPIGNILLTGVTGFLGAHILDSFLKNETGTVYCLIKDKNYISPINRLKNTLNFYFKNKYNAYIGNRIICVNGDITRDNLGLTPAEYTKLGNNIDTVIHSAALVKHFGDYSDFKKINVDGTQRIIKFCKDFDLKMMHISTLSVSGNNFAEGSFSENNFKEEIIYGENKFYIGQNLDNLYVKSKFLAEKAVLEAISEGLKAYILRMGNLTSSFSEGKFQQNHLENAFVNRIKTFLQLGCVPEYIMNGYTEFTPIDYAGVAIIKIANHYDKRFSIFHLQNYKHLTLEKFYDILTELGIHLDILSENDFERLIDKILQDKNKSESIQGIVRDFNSNKKLVYESNIKICSDFTKEFLNQIEFEWPEIDKDYIKKYLNYLISIGFLNIKLKED